MLNRFDAKTLPKDVKAKESEEVKVSCSVKGQICFVKCFALSV